LKLLKHSIRFHYSRTKTKKREKEKEERKRKRERKREYNRLRGFPKSSLNTC
jgi:hypothetical protein